MPVAAGAMIPVQLELVGGLGDAMAGFVVADVAGHIDDREAHDLAVVVGAQVEHVAHLDFAGDQVAGADQLGPHAFDRLDEVAMGLDHDRGGRPGQVDDREGTFGAPASTRCAAGKRAAARRGVALEDAGHGGGGRVGDGDGKWAVHVYIAPEARRSTAPSTSLNLPAVKRSIGFSEPSVRLRPCSQMSAPSAV